MEQFQIPQGVIVKVNGLPYQLLEPVYVEAFREPVVWAPPAPEKQKSEAVGLHPACTIDASTL